MISLFQSTGLADGWLHFTGKQIPSSLELEPIIFEYLNRNFKILDVGCGFGRTAFELEKLGFKNIVGVDMNSNGISYAKKETKRLGKNLCFETGNAEKLDFADGTFDFIITQAFWTTITNGKQRIKIAKELNRVLKVGGSIYIADFGRTWKLAHYRKVYLRGVEDGFEIGTFKAYSKKTGKFMYLAHHHTKNEFFKLLRVSGFCNPVYYKSTIFTTQSGNRINGHVLITRKIKNGKNN